MLSMASHGTRDGLAGSVRNGFRELWEYEKNDTLTTNLPRALDYYENWVSTRGAR